MLQTTFDWTPEQRDELRYTFFYEQLVPRRTTMLQIADGIAGINQRGLTRAEESFARSAENLSWSLQATFGIALAGGFLLALGTIAPDPASRERSGAASAGDRRAPAPICRNSPRVWWARRKKSAASWPANCTTKSGNRFPPS